MVGLWFIISVLVLVGIASLYAPCKFKEHKIFLYWIAPSVAFVLLLVSVLLFFPAWAARHAVGVNWASFAYLLFGSLADLAGFCFGVSYVFALRKDACENSKILIFMGICPIIHLLLYGLFVLFLSEGLW